MKKIKILTAEQAAEKIAKLLVKDVRKAIKNNDSVSRRIAGNIGYVGGSVSYCRWCGEGCDTDDEIRFPVDTNEESLSCLIRDRFNEKIGKLPKSIIRADRTEKVYKSCGWSGYEVTSVKAIVFIKPCKEFLAVQKKLAALGCQPIDIREWTFDDVSGKRSSIFSRYRNYLACSSKVCNKVLAYLKGKRKISYKLDWEEDCEEREYGERYETEWSGSQYSVIEFTDAAGNKTRVYPF